MRSVEGAWESVSSGNVRRVELANGVRIVTEALQEFRSATIGFWVDVGSRDEAPREQGVCHFIEHMMFKGTASLSARDIAERIDAIGGHLNAYTSKEQTCFYARVLDQHLEQAVDLLAEMLLHSSFALADVEKEKGVVIEEIGMVEDTPDELIHDLAAQAALGKHPGGRSVLGSQESIRSFSPEQLRDFVARHYTGKRLVVAAAGHLDHDRLADQLARHFGGLPAGTGPDRHADAESEYRWLVHNKKTEQAHLCLSTPGLAARSPEKWPMLVLDTVLGGGVSSRLFQELREDRGWVYSTYSYHTALVDAGYFTIYAGASPKRAAAVLELTERIIGDLASSGITPQELHRAREHLKGSLMLGLESTSQRMTRLARAELTGEAYLQPDELLAKIEGVTAEQVHALAQRLFRPSQYAYAAVGPVGWKTEARLQDAG